MAEFKVEHKKQQSSEHGTVSQRKGETVLPDNRGQVSQARALTDNRTAQLSSDITAKPNNTGLPNQLKTGIESLSGMSMDHVKVHYNSSQPAQLNAHAYAQGSNIHLAPGQEKHLPHEAWHVVQQAQGRVKPTTQMAGAAINNDKNLEREADTKGAEAVAFPIQRKEQPVQLMPLGYYLKNTPLKTAAHFRRTQGWEGVKDVIDPRRWRLNPLNIIEGFRNEANEAALGSNYHSSSVHGAHNTLSESESRLALHKIVGKKNISKMVNHYTGAKDISKQKAQGRFNSEAWESFSWRKAKENFEAGTPAPYKGNIHWVAAKPAGVKAMSTWKVSLYHKGSDVGVSQVGAATNSVDGVRVAINYTVNAGKLYAWNGQMFPETGNVAPGAGKVIAGDPIVPLNGVVIPIPYQFLGYFGI